ncbi:ribosome-binding factor A [Moraxella marmotae]|uniref:ribosome-binding factor A n=1 Tax=Moraxella marmotae TaxID=3344520 RepID=UPI0035F2D96E
MNQRLQRLADQIQRTLATLIRDEINDPRLTGFVTISGVKVSPDLGYADIYVTILEPSQDGGMNIDAHRDSLKVLNSAAGFLRTELSRTMKTRTTPRLRFHYDEVTAHGNHMMNLVSQAMQKTQESEKNYTDGDDE